MSEIKPIVSIIIPTYKREKSLIRLLTSILDSPYENVEIIVVNMGGFTKKMGDLIKNEFRDIHTSIKVIEGDEDLFVSGAVNLGLQYIKGEYVLICADDVVLEKMRWPGK